MLREPREGMWSRPRFWIKLGLLYGMAHGPLNVCLGYRNHEQAIFWLGMGQITSSPLFILLLRRFPLHGGR